jgi:SAM-dependent methyltransferase
MTYLFDHQWQAERERLAKIEAALDPHTIGFLETIGVRDGWRCLEVGAGGGSIAEWLCRRVGPAGQVVATDLETQFLAALDYPQLEIRQHNILAEDFEEHAFDLVYARKVLEHFADVRPALRRMYGALRPGGWLLVEDSDLVAMQHVSARDPVLFERVYSEFINAMASNGFNPKLGRRLGDELRLLGLERIELHGRTNEWTAAGNHAGGAIYRLTTERLRERILGRGLVTAAELDQYLADIQSPDFHALTGVHFAAWGRKPDRSGHGADG